MPGVNVAVVHVPTGTTYTALSNSSGRYVIRGMIPGGPYTFNATSTGFVPARRTDVVTQLGSDIDVSFSLSRAQEDRVELEAFVVEGDPTDLDQSAGAVNVYGEERTNAIPSARRSIADLASQSPYVTLRALGGTRDDAQIVAVGQNNRFNSIQIDGARINDQFGLNATGLASFFNPLSIDTIEQISVQVSPYDVSQSGFTGASINAVTKSGTNRFSGSLYYYYNTDLLGDIQLEGKDVAGATTGRLNPVERVTRGATFGGPIIKDRLFFFLNYEDFELTTPPTDSGLPIIDAGNLAAITQRFSAYNTASGQTIDWGGQAGQAANVSSDEKILAKLDWNITASHRASLRYSQTEGVVPAFGRFGNASITFSGVSSTEGATALTSNFYSVSRTEESYAAELTSQWTANLRTEFRFSNNDYLQATPTDAIAPEVYIFGVTGVNRLGANVSNGIVVAGTEQFRHGNAIGADSQQISLKADYVLRDILLTFGAERESTEFLNVFRQGSYGLYGFRTVDDFLNDRPYSSVRNVIDRSVRGDADLAEFATTGIYAQAQWQVNPRLKLAGGLRYEFNEVPEAPRFNQDLEARTGFRNDGTLDGASYVSPRASFVLALDDERKTQVRGGVGHFLGRSPWVFFNNSYNNFGVGSFSIIDNAPTQGAFTRYLTNDFDVESPIGSGADTGAGARAIDFTDADIKLPQVYRANLAIDHKIDFLSSSFTAEVIYTKNIDTLFTSNENLRAIGAPAADGRQRFAGNTNQVANRKFADYTNLFRVRNEDVGESLYFSLSWDRPIINGWGFNASYTRGHSRDAQASGETTASSQWGNNVLFNRDAVEVSTSDFEIKHSIQVFLTREFRIFDRFPTRVSTVYEGRSGSPFSWVYRTDINGDSVIGNDLVAVPMGVDDPRFNFSSLSASQQEAYFEFFSDVGLDRYAGGIAPRNSDREPWISRLDLKVSQRLPIAGPMELELFFDWINFGAFISKDLFGYVDRSNNLSNQVYRRRFVGNASYDAQGLIVPTLAPDTFITDNDLSRWRVQFGARLTF